jgi:hypothetical protein
MWTSSTASHSDDLYGMEVSSLHRGVDGKVSDTTYTVRAFRRAAAWYRHNVRSTSASDEMHRGWPLQQINVSSSAVRSFRHPCDCYFGKG